MSAQEIIIAIKELPIVEQIFILQTLSQSIEQVGECEAEVVRLLVAKGLLSVIPDRADDEDDESELIEVSGKPISETIIEERSGIGIS